MIGSMSVFTTSQWLIFAKKALKYVVACYFEATLICLSLTGI